MQREAHPPGTRVWDLRLCSRGEQVTPSCETTNSCPDHTVGTADYWIYVANRTTDNNFLRAKFVNTFNIANYFAPGYLTLLRFLSLNLADLWLREVSTQANAHLCGHFCTFG